MKAVLDTHALLWMAGGDPQLSAKAIELITDPTVHLYVSIASLWEIAIKLSIGKLPMKRSLSDLIRYDIHGNMIEILQIGTSHLKTLSVLPFHHRDPFDRMIIAQAIAEDLVVIGADSAFKSYDIDLHW